MASSPIKISHRFPQSFLFSSSNSTNRTTTNAAPNIYPGAVRLKPVCSAAASASGPAEPAKVKPATTRPKKPVYSMKKGQIVRYLSVDHPPYYKGLDYIYEDRGEVLDIRNFETGECALIAWVGIPIPPAWLPTDMLIKSEKLDYERI
ncbi:NADH dehydrogenase-like complex O [Rhynchospora pubera]|uniref:NADH dehydrogenase-like complex O n=1 Tax=Rhynchospora pubera TaxID=906938 RepID=A0AAV8FYU2_9POAL|nr:NADH dehydrogenase-like complex O [Rhynchospora pubera]